MHVPRATIVIVAPLVPPAVHTVGVVVVNVTAKPVDAVALTTIERALSVAVGSGRT